MPFDVIAAALSAVILGLTLLGLGVKFVLLPWLREHLIVPVQQTNHQVTQNHHTSDEPTVLDRIDDVKEQIRALGRMYDGHLEWAQYESDRIWAELHRKRNR